jgi:hypothetical protein
LGWREEEDNKEGVSKVDITMVEGQGRGGVGESDTKERHQWREGDAHAASTTTISKDGVERDRSAQGEEKRWEGWQRGSSCRDRDEQCTM